MSNKKFDFISGCVFLVWIAVLFSGRVALAVEVPHVYHSEKLNKESTLEQDLKEVRQEVEKQEKSDNENLIKIEKEIEHIEEEQGNSINACNNERK